MSAQATVLTVDYSRLTDDLFRQAICRIITTSHNISEVRRRIANELAYPHHVVIHSAMPQPRDVSSANELAEKLGGQQLKSGGVITVMLQNSNGVTIHL